MISRKTTAIMMLLGSLIYSQCQAQPKPEQQTVYHKATDAIIDAFGELLYPLEQLGGKIFKKLSPHHPIIKDIKETADHIGKVTPKIAQEVTKIAEEFTEKAKDKAREMSDYALEKTEQTTKRICDDASQRITETSTKALDNMQKTIEVSVHDAAKDATQQIERSIDHTAKRACADLTDTSEKVMATVHQELTESATDMAHEFEIGADRIVNNAAYRFGNETKKSIALAAKASILTVASSASIIIMGLGIYKYMYEAQSRDVGFVAIGLAGAVASYKALDKLYKDNVISS